MAITRRSKGRKTDISNKAACVVHNPAPLEDYI